MRRSPARVGPLHSHSCAHRVDDAHSRWIRTGMGLQLNVMNRLSFAVVRAAQDSSLDCAQQSQRHWQLRTASACSAQLPAWGDLHSSAARAQLLQVCSCARIGTADAQLCACSQSELARACYTRVYAPGRAFCGRCWAHVTATASTVRSPTCRLIFAGSRARLTCRKLE